MDEDDNTGDTIELEVRCPVETRVLGIIRTFMASLASQMGFSHEEADQIEMAVDEACANVVRHAYKHLGVSPDLPPEKRRSPSEITDGVNCVLKLGVRLGQDAMQIRIIDHGIGKKNCPPGVSSMEEYVQHREGKGGLGSLIIKNFMDEVEYDYPEDRGTVLTMTKYLTHAQ